MQDGPIIRPAIVADAPEVLVLERCCWIPEAAANQDWTIPPLTETLDEIRAWMPTAWVMRDGPRLIGGVRATASGRSWVIGRLMVAPDRQGEGLGGRLLRHAEAAAPAGTEWFELFTGQASAANIARYCRTGYAIYQTAPGLVYLRKAAGA